MAAAAVVAAASFASACRKGDAARSTGTGDAATGATGLAPTGQAATTATSAAASVAPAAPPPAPASFSSQVPPSFSTPSRIEGGCAIDVVEDKPASGDAFVVKAGAPMKMAGWAADPATGEVPPTVIVELAGPKATFFARAARGPKRPDVAKALGDPGLVDAGFEMVADTTSVPAGTYVVRVDQVSSAGAAFTCEPRRKLKVM